MHHFLNSTQIDDVQYVDVVMPMYNLIEYYDNYAKTSGSLWQYCREKLDTAVNNILGIVDFNGINLIHLILKWNKQVKWVTMGQKMLK